MTRRPTKPSRQHTGWIDDVSGEDLVEYGLLAALIAVVAVAMISSFGVRMTTVLWQNIVNNF